MYLTKEKTADIRAKLKALGYSSRDVSVRVTPGGSIRVEVKNPDADFGKIREVATAHESIRRDGWGEILSGGNTFVFVEWSREARKARSDRYIDRVEAAIFELEREGRGSNILVPLYDELTDPPLTDRDVKVLVGWDRPGYGFRLLVDGIAGLHFNTAECGAAIVADYVDGCYP